MEDLNVEDDPRHWELEAISSIYPELKRAKDGYAFTLEFSPDLVAPMEVAFKFGGEEGRAVRFQIQYLPKLEVEMVLPDGYPESVAPELSISAKWLPKDTKERLEQEAKDIWERNGGVESVFDIVDQIQRYGEEGFDLAKDGVWNAPTELIDVLPHWDRLRKKEIFDQGTYMCGVCLEPHKGSISHKLSHCGHVFCKDCLMDLYTTAIQTGDISMIRCPDPTCAKADADARRNTPPKSPANEKTSEIPNLHPTLHPHELEMLGISGTLCKRYLFLKRKAYLDADPETLYCPRKWCGGPARSAVDLFNYRLDAGLLGEFFVGAPPPDKYPKMPNDTAAAWLQICSHCNFAYCRVCSASWHGESYICRPKAREKTEQELKDEEYLKSISTKCPTCQTPTIKARGCNHITCRCGTHFCFLCGSYLLPDNPYMHFNTKGQWCYMRLWDGEEGDLEEEVEWHD